MNKFVIIILSFSLVLLPFLGDDVGAFDSCEIVNISSGCSVGFSKVGDVTGDGHFAVNGSVGLNYLCCNSSYSFGGSGRAMWHWGDNDGQSHVWGPNQNASVLENSMNFSLGLGAAVLPISVNLSNTLNASQLCFFRISSDSSGGGHIAPCVSGGGAVLQNDSFDFVLATSPTEICDNGVDDTGDGLVDCASPTCHPSIQNAGIPQICTGNNQTTVDCFDSSGNLKDHCRNNITGDYYYCSYGSGDNETDPSSNPEGVCCLEGWAADYDSVTDTYSCTEFRECHVPGNPSTSICNYNISFDLSGYIAYEYDSSMIDPEDNFCISAQPEYFDRDTTFTNYSTACCLIEKHGTSDYFFDEGNNIQIFG